MRRFILPVILILVLISVSLTQPRPAQCAARCDVVNSLCTGQADLLNELCKAMGGSVDSCMRDYINYYNECVTNNGCVQLIID